jgi:hypothetical protein
MITNWTSLEFLSSNKVNGFFDCRFNNLTSLENCPYEAVLATLVILTDWTSLEFCPTEAGGVSGNNSTTSLEFCPTEVGGDFYVELQEAAQ